MTAITIEAINPKILLPHATRHVCIDMIQCYRRPVRHPRAADVPIQRHAKKYHASGADFNNTPHSQVPSQDGHRECICRAQRRCYRCQGGSLAGGAFSAAPHRQSVEAKTVVLIPQGTLGLINADRRGEDGGAYPARPNVAMCIGVDRSSPFSGVLVYMLASFAPDPSESSECPAPADVFAKRTPLPSGR
jgi:hypothetical protein